MDYINKPKVDIDYPQDIIDECARYTPNKKCESCAATKYECIENQDITLRARGIRIKQKNKPIK